MEFSNDKSNYAPHTQVRNLFSWKMRWLDFYGGVWFNCTSGCIIRFYLCKTTFLIFSGYLLLQITWMKHNMIHKNKYVLFEVETPQIFWLGNNYMSLTLVTEFLSQNIAMIYMHTIAYTFQIMHIDRWGILLRCSCRDKDI